METIEIHQTVRGVGFSAQPEQRTMEGVIFSNGKIAYVDPDDVLYSSESEAVLIRSLKKEKRCIDAEIVRKKGKHGRTG